MIERPKRWKGEQWVQQKHHVQLLDCMAGGASQAWCEGWFAYLRLLQRVKKHLPVSEVVQEAVDGAGRQQAAGVQVCQHSGQVGTGQGLVLQAGVLQAQSQSCGEVCTNASCIAGARQA